MKNTVKATDKAKKSNPAMPKPKAPAKASVGGDSKAKGPMKGMMKMMKPKDARVCGDKMGK